MKKRLWILAGIALVIGLLLGLSYLTALPRCRRAYCNLQEKEIAHYTRVHYNEELYTYTDQVWKNGESYLIYQQSIFKDEIWYMGKDDQRWEANTRDSDGTLYWEKSTLHVGSTFWSLPWERFAQSEVKIRQAGMAVEFMMDLGSENCIGLRQTYTWVFYLDLFGNIRKITTAYTTYDGREIDPENISSNSIDVITLHWDGPSRIQRVIQEAYDRMDPVSVRFPQINDMEAQRYQQWYEGVKALYPEIMDP